MNNKRLILSSRFFDLGNTISVSKNQLETYCRWWWPLQPRFTLGLVMLLGKVAQTIRDSLIQGDLQKENLYKKIFKWQAPAIIDEMGFGRDPYGLMHHDLFLQQVAATTSFSREQLILNPKISPLAKVIEQSFDSVKSGLCMMYVVETIAPELFRTQKNIFLSAGSNLEDLKHSVLHESLELSHADEAEEFMKFLRELSTHNEISEDEIKSCLKIYSLAWKGFLDGVFESIIFEKN